TESQHRHDGPATRAALSTPRAIREEHRHLHAQLEAAIAAGGTTGERARAVAEVLGPHFEEEEAYAMPPLGLLEPLARGGHVSEADARRAIEMAERLRSQYDAMLDEHRQLGEALEALAAAAREEGQVEAEAFAETLLMHAGNEEQVLYPA